MSNPTKPMREFVRARMTRSVMTEAITMLADIVDAQAAELTALKQSLDPVVGKIDKVLDDIKPSKSGKPAKADKPKANKPAAPAAATPDQIADRVQLPQGTGSDAGKDTGSDTGNDTGNDAGNDTGNDTGSDNEGPGNDDQPVLGADLPESQE